MIPSFVHRTAWLFGYRDVPFAVRGIFRQEIRHIAVWGITWGCLNARFCTYVALRDLDASTLQASIIGASQALANILAIWWGSLATRFDRRGMLVASILCVSIVMSSVALIPLAGTKIAAWLFTAQLVLAWVAIQASNTLRTSLWRTNYPDHLRARIMARFAIWQIIIGSITVVVAGAYLDGALAIPLIDRQISLMLIPGARSPHGYANIFLVGAIFGLLAAALYHRVRVRRRGAAKHGERTLTLQLTVPGALGFSDILPGWFGSWVLGARTSLREALDVLREDADYRRYMIWQMAAGSANMMTTVPLVLILDDHFDVSYVEAAGVLALVPQTVMVFTTPFWAGRFDRWNIAQYRSIQMSVWAVAVFLTAVGTGFHSLGLLCVGFGLRGAAEAGGRFAWQLGHMAFAQPHRDALYMGVHQALTGLRGLTAPFLGAVLYWYGLNWHVLWIAVAIQLITIAGFVRMRRRLPPPGSAPTAG